MVKSDDKNLVKQIDLQKYQIDYFEMLQTFQLEIKIW